MSIADISRTSVLDAIRHGYTTRWALAEHFQVLPTFRDLTAAIDGLKRDGFVVEHDGGVLHPNDLIEQIPHNPEES